MDNNSDEKEVLVEKSETDDLEIEESSPKPTFRDSLYPKLKFSVKQMNVIITVVIALILLFIIIGVVTSR